MSDSDPFREDAPPVIALIGGRVAQVGDRVRLHPSARADAFDMLLAGKTARIEDIRQDYEDRVYLMVALDDDPGREQAGERVMPGHRFFFFLDEVELLETPQGGTSMSADTFPGQPPNRVLIACVGNIFLGDDGFGVEVARRLAGRAYPAGVRVVDFGIRGVELAYTLLDGCETLVLVDAIARGGAPGTLYLIEPELDARSGQAAGDVVADAHSMDPARVLAFAWTLGARPGRVLLVGCEPAALAGDGNGDDLELHMGLSEPVRAALDGAVEMIDALIEDLLVPANAGERSEMETGR